MLKLITTKPGEIIPLATSFVENVAIGEPTDKRGKIERVDYTTSVYEDGVTYQKYCNVYLPYGYDPDDKGKKYNVVYYQHGNSCDPELFVGENQMLFDALFATGEVEPCIVVFTTYYFDVTKDVEERRRTGSVPAGDGNWDGAKGYFYKEVAQDIIPAVETRYNTYLTEASDAGIKATRDHRAFSGYSRGSVATWKLFHYDFEYFRWFAPMSCHITADHNVRDSVPQEEILAYLQQPILAHPELPFFIYASNGYPRDVAQMTEQMKFIVTADSFSYGQDPKQNNLYFALSNFTHSDLYAPYYFYNSLQVLFKA